MSYTILKHLKINKVSWSITAPQLSMPSQAMAMASLNAVKTRKFKSNVSALRVSFGNTFPPDSPPIQINPEVTAGAGAGASGAGAGADAAALAAHENE